MSDDVERRENRIEQEGQATLSNVRRIVRAAESGFELAVADGQNYVRVCEMELQINRGLKEAQAYFKERKDRARKVWQDWIDMEKKVCQPYEQALDIAGKARIAYEQEQERKRREEERKIQEEANARREEEAMGEAEKLEAMGEAELAEKALADAAPVPVIVPSTVPQVPGVGKRQGWKWRLKDARGVKKGYLVQALNEKLINAIVRSQGKLAEKIVGGIEVYPVDTPTRRRI